MQPRQTTWHILGVGSLGCLWATRLAAAGLPVQLVLRNAERLVAYQQANGLTLEHAGHGHTVQPSAELATNCMPIQRLVLACKAYDALPLLQTVAPRLTINAEILLLQNGLGSQQAIADAFPQVRCWAVSSTEGAFRRSTFHVVHAGRGSNTLGSWPPSERAPTWLHELEQAQIPHEWQPEMHGVLWRKVAINCAINPLTVLHDCCNGDLRAHASRVNAVCDELATLLAAVGCADTNLHARIWQVIEATAANSSSMRQDVAHGRRTEIAYLLGYACEEATRQQLPLPQVRALLAQLRTFLQARGLPSH